MDKTIIIVGTLDTKGEEIKYVKEMIERRGHKTIVIDGGILGEPLFPPDIAREEVAKAAGTTLKEVIALADEGEMIKAMAEGASKIAQELYSAGRLNGIISLGGTMGTSLGLAVMKALPLGVPKLMVSTAAFTPIIAGEMVSEDQAMICPVAGLFGLNVITRHTLEAAAGTITGMAETYKEIVPEKPLIAVTMRGGSCRYTPLIRSLLGKKGYEVVPFHAVGIGGRALESLVKQGLISGTLDLATAEIVEELCGGPGSAGADRLEAAGKVGIPQVVGPGCLDYRIWAGTAETLPSRLKGRKIHQHNSLVSAIKTSREEMAMAGEVIAKKLNKAIGPAAILIPIRGFSEFDKAGTVFYNPEGHRAFIKAVNRHIEPNVKVIELDMHINDPEFSEQAVAILDDMMRGQTKAPGASG